MAAVSRPAENEQPARNQADFIAMLGLPFLAHRLRRTSALIVDASSVLHRKTGFTGPPRSISTLLLLTEEGPLGITEIASRLRLSHPLIIRLVRGLLETGYVKEKTDPTDARRRIVSLTPKGKRRAKIIEEQISPLMAETFSSVFREMGIDLFAAIEAFEKAVAEVTLAQRLEEMAGKELVRRLRGERRSEKRGKDQ